MVQRDQWDTYWGPKKIYLLIRDIDDATTAELSVPRSPQSGSYEAQIRSRHTLVCSAWSSNPPVDCNVEPVSLYMSAP